ncbi:MAG: T9SS type A sorting domain-containing protein [Bacteroidia bacterium]|nr:T9SS type A sorting domain-containing protein [Bacteroidia bacterium]MBP7773095.1 T9SS type A sorting domain-containing protein [Bacteroidia bacterium]
MKTANFLPKKFYLTNSKADCGSGKHRLLALFKFRIFFHHFLLAVVILATPKIGLSQASIEINIITPTGFKVCGISENEFSAVVTNYSNTPIQSSAFMGIELPNDVSIANAMPMLPTYYIPLDNTNPISPNSSYTFVFQMSVDCNYLSRSNASFNATLKGLYSSVSPIPILINANYSYMLDSDPVSSDIQLTPSKFFFAEQSISPSLEFDSWDFNGNDCSTLPHRTIEYINTGLSTFIGTLNYSESEPCPLYFVNQVSFDLFDPTGSPSNHLDFQFNEADPCVVQINNIIVPADYTIRFRICYSKNGDHFSGCVEDCGSLQRTISQIFQAVCSSGSECTELTRDLNLYNGPKEPDIRITKQAPNNNATGYPVYWDPTPSQTSATPTNWIFRVENIGTDVASNIRFRVNNSNLTNSTYYIRENSIVWDQIFSNSNRPTAVSIAIDLLSNQGTLPGCAANFPDAIASASFSIENMAPGESMTFTFPILECCPGDPINGLFYFDNAIYFNRWSFDNKTYNTDCINSPVEIGIPFIGMPAQKYFSAAGLNGRPDISLEQVYYPGHVDMDMVNCIPTGTGTCCSDSRSYEFVIDNVNFNKAPGSTPPYNFWGAEPLLSTITIPVSWGTIPYITSARIIVDVELDGGLALEGSSGVNTLNAILDAAFFTVGGVNWQFDEIESEIHYQCPGQSIYRLVFLIDQLPGLPSINATDLVDRISGSQFHFFLRGCCDCIDASGSMDANPSYKLNFFFSSGPSACEIPLERQESIVMLHCPGCTLPGPIIHSGRLLERTTFGLEDPENDGRANGSIIANPNTPGVAWNRSMQGDKLQSSVNFHISPASDPNYSIANLFLANPPVNLDKLYLEFRIPHSNESEFDVELTRVTFGIRRLPSIISSFTLTPSSPTWASVFSDQRGNTNTPDLLAFDFQISKIDPLLSTPIAFFRDGDEFEIMLEFCIRGNGINASSSDIALNRIESLIQASAYLTGEDLWSGASPIYDAYFGPQRPVAMDQFTGSGPVDPAWLFVCETRSEFHYFLRKFVSFSTTLYDTDVRRNPSDQFRCLKTLDYRIVSKIGGDLWNPFPFEFRPAPLPGIITFNLATSNIQFDPTEITSYVGTYEPSCAPYVTRTIQFNPLTPTFPTGTGPNYNIDFTTPGMILLLNSNSPVSAAGCTPSTDILPNLYSGDENGIWDIRQRFSLEECNTGIEYHLNPDFSQLILIDQVNPDCSVNTLPPLSSNVFNPVIRPSNPTLNVLAPAETDISTDELIGIIEIQNVRDPVNENYAIENPFIFLPAQSWMPAVNAVSLEVNGSTLNGIYTEWDDATPLNANIPGYLFILNDLPAGNTLRCTLKITIESCNSLITDPSVLFEETIHPIAGWDCQELAAPPLPVREDNMCWVMYLDWDLNWVRSEILVDVTDNIVLDACNDELMQIRYQVFDGTYTIQEIMINSPTIDFLEFLGVALGASPLQISFSDLNQVPLTTLTANVVRDSQNDYRIEISGSGAVLDQNNGLIVNVELTNYCLNNLTMDVSSRVLRYCNSSQILNPPKSVFITTQSVCTYEQEDVCDNDGLQDLTLIDVSAASGPGVILQGGTYFFDPSANDVTIGINTISFNHSLTTSSSTCTYFYFVDFNVAACNPSVFVSSSLSCPGQTTTIGVTSTNIQNPTYSWSINGTILGTSASITVAPVATTIYTVVVTGSGGTTASATATVDVLNVPGPDCCVPSDFTPGTDHALTNTTISAYAAAAGWGSSVNIPEIILINGTLTIDVDFTFIGCDHIVMGPNARIIVEPGRYFQVLTSHVYSCGAMWQSIELNPTASLKISDTHIEDGLTAVKSWGTPALLEVTGNTFDANKTSVELFDGSFTNATFYGNMFYCTRYIKPATNLEWASQHFLLHDADKVQIGAIGKSENHFFDAIRGIHSIRSNVSVQNNVFGRDHNPNAKFGVYATGYPAGILSLPYDLQVGNEASNTFSDLHVGIYTANHYNLQAQNNTLEDNRIAISTFQCMERNIDIRENTIRLSKNPGFGIQLQNNHQAMIQVRNNQVNNAQDPFDPATEGGVGILVNNSVESISSLSIKENEVAHCATGIRLMNQNGAVVAANQISYAVPDAWIDLGLGYRNGIQVQGSENFDVSYNSVVRDCQTCSDVVGQPEYFRGITSDLTTAAHIHDNYLIKAPQGILVRRESFGGYYNCNYFSGGNVGFNFDQAQIDPQGGPMNSTDNQWVNYDNVRLKIAGELDPPGFRADWFFDVSQGVSYDPNPYDPDVLIYRTGLSNNNCAQFPPTIDPQVSLLRLINDSAYTDYLFEKKLYDRKVAYGKLRDSLQLLYAGTAYDVELQNFFNVYALSNQGYLKEIEDLLVNNELAQAAVLNLGLVPTNLHEYNSVEVNKVVIESVGDSIYYNPTQRQELIAIAYQNPIIGGEAVYRARAILRLDLEDMPIGFRSAVSPINENVIRLWPNPTTGQLHLISSLPLSAGSVLSIYSSVGEKLLDRCILPGSTTETIELGNLPGGVYLLRVQGPAELFTERILLVR